MLSIHLLTPPHESEGLFFYTRIEVQTLQQLVRDSFHRSFPQTLEGPRRVRIREGWNIVDSEGYLGDARPLIPRLQASGWNPFHDADTSAMTAVHKGEDIIGTRVSIGTLEVGFAPCETLTAHIDQRMGAIRLIDRIIGEARLHRLNDYSIQPRTRPVDGLWADSQRARILRTHLHPQRAHYLTLPANSQCGVDVAVDEITDITVALNCVSGGIIGLTANSPIWADELDSRGALATQLLLMEDITAGHGLAANVRPQTMWETLDNLIARLITVPFIIRSYGSPAERPGESFAEWYARWWETDAPEPDRFDELLRDHLSTWWIDARPNIGWGSVEVRMCGQHRHALAHHALILGLVENGRALCEFARSQPYNVWRRLRHSAIIAALNHPEVRAISQKLVEIAAEGLRRRGFHEEELLVPLESMLGTKKCPAEAKLAAFIDGGMSALLEMLLQ